MKSATYIMAPEPISTAYLIDPSHQSVCLWIHSIVARQLLGRGATAAKNTHATIEELLNASVSMRSMSYQRKVGDWFFPELLVILTLPCPVSTRVMGPLLCLGDQNYETTVSLFSARKYKLLWAVVLQLLSPEASCMGLKTSGASQWIKMWRSSKKKIQMDLVMYLTSNQSVANISCTESRLFLNSQSKSKNKANKTMIWDF
jgi:hypothetical protein